MEIVVFGCAILGISLAAYFYADSQAEKRLTVKLSELLDVERKEKLEWASKALAKQGAKPLFHVPEKTVDPTPARRVVTRTEGAARQQANNPRIQDTIEKAKDILK